MQLDVGADRTAIAGTAFELELNPVTARLDGVAVNEQRSALVRDDDVEDAAIPQIRERDGAAVEGIPGADHLGDVGQAPGAIVDPHALPFVAGEAAAAHRRP